MRWLRAILWGLAVAGTGCAVSSSSPSEPKAGQGGGGSGGSQPFHNSAMQPATGAAGSGNFGMQPSGGAAGSRMLTPHGCNDLVVEFKPVTPTVMLVIDRSGSMWDAAYGSSPTRWQALYDALVGDGAALKMFDHVVRFGAMTYTGNPQGGMCPIFHYVEPAIDNFAAVKKLVDDDSARPMFKGETPTGAALKDATAKLAALGGSDPQHMILVTDGEPDSCATPDPQCGQDESIAALQAAFGMKIGTSVIGISSDVSARHLQDLANAGQGQAVQAPDITYMYNCINPGFATMSATYAAMGSPQGTAPIFQPGDSKAIGDALQTLIRGVYDCSFALKAEVDLMRANLGTVQLDGAALQYQDANGWKMNDPSTLQLLGTACQRIQQDATKLSISFPCDVANVL